MPLRRQGIRRELRAATEGAEIALPAARRRREALRDAAQQQDAAQRDPPEKSGRLALWLHRRVCCTEGGRLQRLARCLGLESTQSKDAFKPLCRKRCAQERLFRCGAGHLGRPRKQRCGASSRQKIHGFVVIYSLRTDCSLMAEKRVADEKKVAEAKYKRELKKFTQASQSADGCMSMDSPAVDVSRV